MSDIEREEEEFEDGAEEAPVQGREADEDADYERRARMQGWVPESEWDDERAEREGRRKPSRFLTARQWVEKNESNIPLLRSQLRNLEEKLERTSRQNDDMHQILVDQKRMQAQATQRAYERGIAEARAAQRKAVEDMDTAAFDAAKQREEQLIQQRPKIEEPPARQEEQPPQRRVPPDAERWIADNPWFLQNAELNAVMKAEESRVIARLGDNAADTPLYQRLEMAKEQVMRRFPDYFPSAGEDTGRRRTTVMEPTGMRTTGRAGTKRTMADVPEDDRKAFRRQQANFKARGVEYTEAEFLADYEFNS